jgi:hypothetical protein
VHPVGFSLHDSKITSYAYFVKEWRREKSGSYARIVFSGPKFIIHLWSSLVPQDECKYVLLEKSSLKLNITTVPENKIINKFNYFE